MSKQLLILCSPFLLVFSADAADSLQDRYVTKDRLSAADTSLLGKKADQIVVYSATWCSPCKRLHPVLKSLKQEGYKIVQRDVDRDISKLEYKYSAVPTIFFVRNNTVIKTETGYRSKAHLKQGMMPDATKVQASRPIEDKQLLRQPG